ncbi:MAG TPA: PBP1A family penicillin-binding protein [Acetobacteraceae bacterium]|jgi:penicillin-binding protein 1A|nr:PBP1A family penicillin-binding protein [Acetobacteraceae bacterium]
MCRAPILRDERYDTRERFEAPPALIRRRRRLRWRLFAWSLVLVVWAGLALGAALLWFAWDLPRPEAALDAARKPSLTLEDRSGHVFATFGDVVGEPLRLADLPHALPAAAVSVEDRRFYQHGAIDLVGIARALFVNLRARRVVQGGSTITQQVAKNLFLTNARTFRRKVQELLLTVWLEEHFTKDEILEIWLNRVYLGSGAWGVDAAAHIYFGISARKLNLWQSAVIAGLPRAPSRFNPRADPVAAGTRGREVLAAMAEVGAITPAQAEAAGREITFPEHPDSAAGWFADWVADEAQEHLESGADATLRTTLDPRLQAVVESRLRALLSGPGAAAAVTQGAVVVLDAASGEVRAMSGGRDYRASSYNRAVFARRQPGSSFKPFVWLAALEKGARPDDLVLDAPVRFGSWSPSNFEGRFRGEVTLEDALADSINTAAVRLLIQAGGPMAVAAVAHRLGIADALPDNVTLALGTADVGVLEVAGAYAAFFNGGLRVTPTGLRAIVSDGHGTGALHSSPARVIDPDLAAMMVRMMGAVVARGSGRAAAVPGRFVAGKTGTTQDYRDAWFVGAVNGTVIAVWLGNDDNTPMRGVIGGSLPAKLFHDIAVAAAP